MVIIPIAPMEKMEFSKPMTSISEGPSGLGLPFENVLKSAVEELGRTQQVADQDAYSLALGDVDNLAQMWINSSKAEAALSTTVQLTTRTVNAYKEIMQMQV